MLTYAELGLIANDKTRDRFEDVLSALTELAEAIEA